MSFARRPLLAGNWKMNGLRAALAQIQRAAEGYDATLREKLDLLILPPGDASGRGRRHRRAGANRRGRAGLSYESERARTPAIFRPQCWPTPAPPSSLSVTANGAPIMARADALVRPGARGAGGRI